MLASKIFPLILQDSNFVHKWTLEKVCDYVRWKVIFGHPKWPPAAILLKIKKQGNSVARDLPPTGSEANTTIVVFIYILDIDSHCPYLLLFF